MDPDRQISARPANRLYAGGAWSGAVTARVARLLVVDVDPKAAAVYQQADAVPNLCAHQPSSSQSGGRGVCAQIGIYCELMDGDGQGGSDPQLWHATSREDLSRLSGDNLPVL